MGVRVQMKTKRLLIFESLQLRVELLISKTKPRLLAYPFEDPLAKELQSLKAAKVKIETRLDELYEQAKEASINL